MATRVRKAKQRLKGANVRISDLIRRITYYLQYANNEAIGDGESMDASMWNSGFYWYNEANDFAKRLVKIIAPPTVTPDPLQLSKACAIIAALSPQVTWEQNKKLAEQFIETGKCNTTGDRLNKCKAIMEATTEDEIFNSVSKKGLKTRAFYMNIRHPEITHMVTIDRHAIAGAMQLPHSTEALDALMQKVTDLQYAFFQEAYIKAAERWNANLVMNDTHNIITPQQCQAIVWVTYRKLRGLN